MNRLLLLFYTWLEILCVEIIKTSNKYVTQTTSKKEYWIRFLFMFFTSSRAELSLEYIYNIIKRTWCVCESIFAFLSFFNGNLLTKIVVIRVRNRYFDYYSRLQPSLYWLVYHVQMRALTRKNIGRPWLTINDMIAKKIIFCLVTMTLRSNILFYFLSLCLCIHSIHFHKKWYLFILIMSRVGYVYFIVYSSYILY